ncbi:MAG: FMN-binding protein [Christensenellales bacterium]
MKKKMAAWIALGIITVVAALALAMTNEVTKKVIEQQGLDAEVKARVAVLPAADTFEKLDLPDMGSLSDLYVGLKDAQPQGYVGTVMAKGYGGQVQVIAGVDADGKVTGVSVGGKDFAETAGLGAKSKEPAFSQQFIGKQSPIKVVKKADDRGDNTIDAITAATITTNAVTGAVNNIARKVDEYLHPAGGDVAEGTRYTASEEGFGGPVAVLVTVKDDGTITALSIGDNQFAETEGFGAGALEPAFQEQFIGKKVPLVIEDIDAISGATYTTKAVVAAINRAYEEKLVVAPEAAEGMQYAASEEGFAGPVAVLVTVKDDGTITALSIGDDQFAETEGFGAGALDPAFQEQFIGKKVPLVIEDIDAISGATYTTKAVVAAINKAVEEKTRAADASVSEVPQATPEVTQAPAATEAPLAAEAPKAEGTQYTASEEGFGGPVAVLVTVKDDGNITALSIGDEQFAETEGYGAGALAPAFQEQFIGKKVPLVIEDIDAISGATYTTKAVVAAINRAYEEKLVVAPEAAEGMQYAASEEGFAGQVAVLVTLKDDGTITALTIGDDQFAETEGYGAGALEPAFQEQFIGKKVPLTLEDIDAVSGATYTTKAVVAAINKAAEQMK